MKTKQFLLAIWKDPVWSKVIAAAIIFLTATIWTAYGNFSLTDILYFIANLLTTPFPLYLTLSILGAAFLFRYFLKFFKPKSHPIWQEKLGNYTFQELFTVLHKQSYAVRTKGMEYARLAAPKENLFELFMAYDSTFNAGVTIDNQSDGGYLYGVLCPKLVSYGLITRTIIEAADLEMVELAKYQTSELGHKFHSLVERAIILGELKKIDEKKEEK